MKAIRFNQFLPVLLLVFLTEACQKSEPIPVVRKPTFEEEEFGNLPKQLADSLRAWGPEVQRVAIQSGEKSIVRGSGGTTVMVWPESLLDANGKPYKGAATLTLKSHMNMGSALFGNLHTQSGGKILQTQGMVYVNITDPAGNALRVNPQSPIRIEMPLVENPAGYQFFSGSRDSTGTMDWKVAGEPSKELIPFPIKSLTTAMWGECPHHFGFKEGTPQGEYDASYYTFDDITKYENTILATREFRRRYYSHCSPELTKVYLAHLNGPMWEADEAMVAYFVEDSIKRMTLASKPPVGLRGGPPTKDQLEAHQSLYDDDLAYSKYMLETFRGFAAQRLGRINPDHFVPDTLIAESNRAVIAFDALEMGWINVDRFMNDSTAVSAKVEAEITGGEPSLIALVLPTLRSSLQPKSNVGNLYAFTQADGNYSKLPRDEVAYIVAMGIDAGKVVFGMERIETGQAVRIPVAMKPQTKLEIQAALSDLQLRRRQSM